MQVRATFKSPPSLYVSYDGREAHLCARRRRLNVNMTPRNSLSSTPPARNTDERYTWIFFAGGKNRPPEAKGFLSDLRKQRREALYTK